MTLTDRLQAFHALGDYLRDESNGTVLAHWADEAHQTNSWFTTEFVRQSLQRLAEYFLEERALTRWTAAYPALTEARVSRHVGLILAGNLPAVGFHDVLCVLVAGHRALLKPSTQDTVLMRALFQELVRIEPRFADQIEFTERLNHAEALIATGSDNSARYFEYYFRDKPHLIRKNRTSVGVLTGTESGEELYQLGCDVLTYYGLGCRNVSKLYVPRGYSFTPFYDAIEPLGDVILNHKYLNNYEYNKSIYLVNQTPFLDNGFLMLTENEGTVSPISVVFHEPYDSPDVLREKLAATADKTQCVVSSGGTVVGSLPFGTAQTPALHEYADGVDTLAFLVSLT